MVTTSEAFDRFETWRTAKTSLFVSVIERDKPEDMILGVCIDALDLDANLVGIRKLLRPQYAQFDVGEAQFSLEPGRMVVSRNDVEWLIFEETNQ